MTDSGLCHTAAGVRTDLEALLSKFTEIGSVRYEEFVKIWKEMQFSLIFYGRQDMRDLWMFVEELFAIAVSYVLPPYTFQVRVGALYAMYGLYFKQPNLPKIKFRITPEKWTTLLQFIEEASSQSHLDVCYIFYKLRYNKAFHFVATLNQFDPMLRGASEAEDKKNFDDEDSTGHNLLSELFDSANIEHLAEVHDQYHRLKCALGGPENTKPDTDIDLIHSNLIHNITKIVAGFEEFKKTGKKSKRKRRDSGGITTSESEGESDSELPTTESKNQGSIRQEIKARAFSGPIESPRSRKRKITSPVANTSTKTRKKKVETITSPTPRKTGNARSPSSPKKKATASPSPGKKKTEKQRTPSPKKSRNAKSTPSSKSDPELSPSTPGRKRKSSNVCTPSPKKAVSLLSPKIKNIKREVDKEMTVEKSPEKKLASPAKTPEKLKTPERPENKSPVTPSSSSRRKQLTPKKKNLK